MTGTLWSGWLGRNIRNASMCPCRGQTTQLERWYSSFVFQSSQMWKFGSFVLFVFVRCFLDYNEKQLTRYFNRQHQVTWSDVTSVEEEMTWALSRLVVWGHFIFIKRSLFSWWHSLYKSQTNPSLEKQYLSDKLEVHSEWNAERGTRKRFMW